MTELTAFPVRATRRVVIRWVLLARTLWTEPSPVEERNFAGDPGRNLGQILLGWTLASLCLLSGVAWPQVITEYPLGDYGPDPVGIAAGPDGNLWFTQYNNNLIGRITPLVVYTRFSAGISAGSTPNGITAGPDGNLWFTQTQGNSIGRITPLGVVTEFTAGITPGAQPYGITAGPDGNLWFTQFGKDSIGRITPLGVVTEFSTGIPAGYGPSSITLGPDGNLWFTQYGNNSIGRITPLGVVTEFTVGFGFGAWPYGITAGPDGNLWFTQPNGPSIGRITPLGVVTEFTVGITPGAWPLAITAGPDGNLWFTTSASNSGFRIGRITPLGVVTEFSVGIHPGYSEGITLGPDGNLWFTDRGRQKIGRVAFNGVAPATTFVTSASNAAPTGITSLAVVCPTSGVLAVTGSGESAAKSNFAGNAFIGLAYSIARDSTATDNWNVVQSSALAVFKGDANREFLNVQRVDTCTPGAAHTYTLTAYATTPQTSIVDGNFAWDGSFVWNGRLTASAGSVGSSSAAGITYITSATNATPTVVTSLPVVCPASGAVVLSGSGESAAVSGVPGNSYIGFAYSIARDGTATDNGNMVQSSALSVFNTDANRDFLNVQRVDACVPGTSSTYYLTAYATTAQTSITNTSFVFNGRLTATMAPVANSFAPGTMLVGSAANAAPSIVTSLNITCPTSGKVVVSGSGESAAISSFAGPAFIGLAYSIARDSTATDNGNVVQSSTLAAFNGDTNRDFLNVQRTDTCTPGALHTYNLTAYATTPQTNISNGSFVGNGRLVAVLEP